MPKFLIDASYTAEGLNGLLKDGGTGRRAAVEAAVKSLGGKLETMYFAFGKHDTVTIIDVPDNVSAAALALAVSVAATGYPAWSAARLQPVEILRYE